MARALHGEWCGATARTPTRGGASPPGWRARASATSRSRPRWRSCASATRCGTGAIPGAERVTASAFAAQALDRGLAARADLERIAEGWRAWARDPEALFLFRARGGRRRRSLRRGAGRARCPILERIPAPGRFRGANRPFARLFGFLSPGHRHRPGHGNTLVMVRGRGIVIDETSIVAIDRNIQAHPLHRRGRAAHGGAHALQHRGRAPPARRRDLGLRGDGADAQLLHPAPCGSAPSSPSRRSSWASPSGVTEVEKRAVHDAALSAARAPATSSRSAGRPPSAPACPSWRRRAAWSSTIGGGTTEVAVISLGGMVVSRSIRTAGDEDGSQHHRLRPHGP